jgi:O-antigen/teichoic acid export membrane protein
MIITQTDMLMLTYFTTTHDVGLYAVALPISLLLLFFMRPINIVFAPLIAKYSAEKKEKELTETISTAYKYAFVLLVPIVLCFTLFPELIISLLFSNEYIPAVHALQILAVGTLFYSFSLFNSIIFNGLGKAKVMAVVVALISLLNIILNLFLIPTYTITGAAISTSISYILLFIISTTYISKEISLTFPVQQWMKALLSGAVTIMVIIIIKRNLAWNNVWEAIVCGSVLFVLYVILVLGLRAINLAEIRKWISSVTQ